MKISEDFLSETTLSALAISVGFALSATSADALTVSFEASSSGTSTGSLTIADGDPLDGTGNSTPDGSVGSLSSFTVGGFTVNGFNAVALETTTASFLQTTQLRFSGGGIGETLTVTTADINFSAGANAPGDSIIKYSLGGSQLNGTISGSGTVDDGTTVFTSASLAFDTTGSTGTGAYSGNDTSTSVVSSPFDMTTTLIVGPVTADQVTTADNTLKTTAIVPLPAGGLLLLTALGGVALLRGRRRGA
mgnify:CR=1 FL=1